MKIKSATALIALIFIMGIMLATPVMGYPLSSYTVASMDAHVYDVQPDTNYGRDNYLDIGGDAGIGRYEAYIYFDLRSKPNKIIQTEFVIQVFTVQGITDFLVHIVDDPWNEDTLTWNNKPNYGPPVGNFTADHTGMYIFEAPAIAALTELSICIRTNQTGQVRRILVTAREISTGHSHFGPGILWTFDGTLVVPGYNVLFIIAIIGSIGILLAIIMRKRLKFFNK